MASEIRANILKNRVGLGTVSFTNTGPVVSGIVTATSLDISGDIDVDGHTNLDNVSIAGVSTFSGVINANNGINLTSSDNKSILLGASDDMRIRHTGSHSEITDEGTGDLRLGSNRTVIGNATFSETQARFIQNGAVELYHDNIKRLETSSVGVSIPQDLDVDGHTNLDNVNIAGVVTATTFVGNGDFVELDVDGHTNLDNVSIAGVTTTTSNIEIKGNNKYLKLGASDQFAFVTVGAQSFITNSTGHLTGRSASYTFENVAGTTEYFRIGSNGKVGVNTTGPSQQFTSYAASGYPILANGPSNGIGLSNHGVIVFGTKDVASYAPGSIDASNLQLKISGSPKMIIDGNGNIAFNRANATVGDSTAGSATATPNRFVFNNNYSNGYTDASLKLYLFNEVATRQGFTSGPLYDLQYHSSGHATHAKHSFYTQNVERLRIDASGYITAPNNVAFSARGGPSDVTDAVIVFGTIVFQRGGTNYSTSTGYFTAPVDGIYHFMCNPYRYSTSADSVIFLEKSTNGGSSWSQELEIRAMSTGASGWFTLALSNLIDLNANDLVRISAVRRVHCNGVFSRFSGFLVA